MPRKTKLTTDLQTMICGYVNAGASIPDACKAAGVSWNTAKDWLKYGREGRKPYADFVEAVERSKAAWKVGSVAVITKHGRKDWRASAWLLERRDPAFAPPTQRVDLGVSFEQKITERFARLKTLLSPGAWGELEAALKKMAEERKGA